MLTVLGRRKILIVGDYEKTRIVEQLTHEYERWFKAPPNLKELIKLKRTENNNRKLQKLPFETWLLVFEHDLPDERTRRQLLYNAFHMGFDLLILEKYGLSLSPPEKSNITTLIVFPLSNLEWKEKIKLQYQNFKIDEWPNEDALLIQDHPYQQQTFMAWSKYWSPEMHLTFPKTLRDKIYLILLAQRDANSFFTWLNKDLLMEIFSWLN